MMSRKRIVLDAGHVAGYNQSPVYKSYREGDMTWALYQMLRDELIEYGFDVVGTRGNASKDLEVYQRGQAAAGAELFVSLHSNACGSEGVRRVVIIPPFRDQNGTYELANEIGRGVSEVMGISDRYQIYNDRTFIDASGKTRDYYGVVRGAVDAGCKRIIIIEHGFHTNVATAKWLSQTANLKRLAIREAEIFAGALGGVKVAAGERRPGEYAVGDKYTVRAGDRYSTGATVAAFCVGRTMTVKRVLPGRILLDEINSWVII